MEAIQQITTQLGIDSTFFPLFVMIVALYFVLSTVYLKPYQRLFVLRKQKTTGTEKDADELMKQADEKFETYQKNLKSTHHSARRVMKKLNEEAVREEEKILGEAQDKAKQRLQELQAHLETEKKEAMKVLSGDIPKLSQEIAAKVLGRALESSRG